MARSRVELFERIRRDRRLETPAFHDRKGADERRGLSPLFWTHINPYGRFRLDMNTRLDLTAP